MDSLINLDIKSEVPVQEVVFEVTGGHEWITLLQRALMDILLSSPGHTLMVFVEVFFTKPKLGTITSSSKS